MDPLIDPQSLARLLDDSDLRVFDSTVHLASGASGLSGRADWEAGHVPGSGFIDLLADLSEPDAALPYTRPSAPHLERALGRLGISERSPVVVYSSTLESTMWATRLWWLLRAAGIEDVAVLDGGFARWRAQGHPVSTEPCLYPATACKVTPDDTWWATKAEVRAAIDDGGVCTLNALPRGLHTGESEMGYKRPGHIAGSRNVPFTRLVDATSGTLLDDPALRAHFDQVGAFEKERVISYCGGGIAATLNGFVLRRLGHPDVAVYDGSINEWSRDPAMPMETGEG